MYNELKGTNFKVDICCQLKLFFSVDGSILISENDEFLKKGSEPVLLIESKGHALHAFVNQKYQGYPLTGLIVIALLFIFHDFNLLSIRHCIWKWFTLTIHF